VPTGGGQFSLRDLRWADQDLAQSDIIGRLLLRDGQLRFQDVTGILGQGELRAVAAYNLRQPDRSWINLALDNVEAARLFAPWPALANRTQGLIDFRLRGSLGRTWHGFGSLVMARGRVSGLEVSDWRLPFDFAFYSGQGLGEIRVRETNATVALGRLTGTMRVLLGFGTQVQGQVHATDLDLRALLRQLGSTSHLAAGKVSGRVDFSGADVHSLDDLTGPVNLTLREAQPMQMPVLSQLAPFLGPLQGSSSFTSGDLRGWLVRGGLHIDRATLTGRLAQLFISGLITYQGRLDLDVLAQLGPPNPRILRPIGIGIPFAGAIPVTALTLASNYLSNRLIHLRVGGTLRSPVIQVAPIVLLAEEAVRFFLP
jgi:hypothetical protein